jgi:ribosomal protein S18 acetylase RimI-like enzyme
MKIRQAIHSDNASISKLMLQLGYESTPELILENLKYIAASKTDAVFVVEGVISCHLTKLFHQAGYAGRITSLIIDSNSRERNIGKQLMAEAETFFKINHCIKSEVTSGDHRIAAHDFYQSCGYKVDERRFIKVLS